MIEEERRRYSLTVLMEHLGVLLILRPNRKEREQCPAVLTCKLFLTCYSHCAIRWLSARSTMFVAQILAHREPRQMGQH